MLTRSQSGKLIFNSAQEFANLWFTWWMDRRWRN